MTLPSAEPVTRPASPAPSADPAPVVVPPRRGWLQDTTMRWAGAIRRARGTMRTPWQRLVGGFESLFVDHAIFRVLYGNRGRVSPKLWRSAQPSPRQIAWFARRGVKTVINLRGERDSASYLLEVEACRRHGLRLIDYPIRSRELPAREVLQDLPRLFADIEYPALVHCKVGADRAGMMSALYLMLAEAKPPAEAARQLSLRYGHVRQSKSGVLDRFFEVFGAHQARTGEDFQTWVATVYDPWQVKVQFRSARWADTLYDRVLRRE